MTLTLHRATSIWRHWGCVSKIVIRNAKKKCGEAASLLEFDTLSQQDQARVLQAWEDEDIVTNTVSSDGHDDLAGPLENLILADPENSRQIQAKNESSGIGISALALYPSM